MYIDANTFKHHIGLADNGALSEFEYDEFGGIVARLIAIRQFDGIGNLRLNPDMQPLVPRTLLMGKLFPPYRLRSMMAYEAEISLKMIEELPPGYCAQLQPTTLATAAGLILQSKNFHKQSSFLRTPVFTIRPVEMDGLYPLAVLRFLKMDVSLKAREDNSEEKPPPKKPKGKSRSKQDEKTID